MSEKKTFVYLTTDELARARWLNARRDEVAALAAGPAGSNGRPWELEVGPVVVDCFAVKAQLFTRGKLFPRKVRLATELSVIGDSLGLRFVLFDRPTATTLVYHVYATDPDQFRTVRLTGRAARVMQQLDDFNRTGICGVRFQQKLDAMLAQD